MIEKWLSSSAVPTAFVRKPTAQRSQNRHGRLEIFAGQRLGDVSARFGETLGQGRLFRLPQQRRLDRPVIGAPVPLLLDRDDIRCAAISDQQIGAVLRGDEFRERGNTREQADEIVFGQREDRRDQIVTNPLFAQMHLQPVGDEREQLAAGVGLHYLGRQSICGPGEGGAERQAEPVFEDQPDYAECRAPQSERIA